MGLELVFLDLGLGWGKGRCSFVYPWVYWLDLEGDYVGCRLDWERDWDWEYGMDWSINFVVALGNTLFLGTDVAG
jgi:hypothetical protein